jgi:aspartate aminotransferase
MTFSTSAAVRRVEQASLRAVMGPAPADVVSLAMGEPDFDTPAPVVAAGIEALQSGATHYVDQNGDPELRTAIADSIADATGVRFAPSDVLVTHGATAGLGAVMLGVIDPGDRVVIPEPCYSLYPDLVRLAGGEPVFVPCGPDLHWDFDALTAALPHARMIVFSNPCNPTGIVHTRAELEHLSAALHGTSTLVVADEAYDSIVFDGNHFAAALTIPGLAERTVYCQTLSKTYAMTGWRLGYLAGPTEVIAAASRVHRTFNGSVNAAVQRAAIAAIQHGPDLAEPMRAAFRERRDVIAKRVADIPGLWAPEPEGAFYVFVRYDLPLPSTEVTAALKDAGVLVRAGAEYGPSGEGALRLSFAASVDDINTALDRIAEVLARLASEHGTDRST